jgi:peptide/nickel transport system substrate-binding protein
MVENLSNKNVLLVSFVIMLLCCSGCINFSNIDETHSQKKDTLIWGVLSAASIDPLDISNDNFWTIVPNVFNGLVEFDKDFRIIPALAVSWNNPDNLTWRFSLRKGVKFHNGNVFTAEDVKYSFDSPSSGFGSVIENISILDNYTVELRTFEPYPGLLSRLAHIGIIFYRGAFDQLEEQKLIGTGAYRVTDYEIDNYTTLERFDEYWGEKPEIKTSVFKILEDDQERLNALLTGAIDIAEYNIDDTIDQILREENITVVKYPPLSTYYIGFDMRENNSYGFPDDMNPTADVRVRKAIYHAINITPLIQGPFHGYAQPESQIINPFVFGYNPRIERLAYNVTAAKQLLAEAGYDQGFDIVMDCITEGYDYNAENSYLIAQQLSAVGIHVTLNNLSMDEYNTKVIAERNTSMYLLGYGTISVDGGWIYDLFIRSVGDSLGRYNSGY